MNTYLSLVMAAMMLIDNDGNDFVYYSTNRPITEKAFLESRAVELEKTLADSYIYCPWSAGFGNFTVPGIGDTYTNSVPWGDTRNPIKEFFAKGLDPLKMVTDHCHRLNRKVFLGLRWNDTHDAYHPQLVPDWKKSHPECLFGAQTNKPPRCSWSAVDFERAEVREYMKDFVRKFLTRYDLDGIEYDFFRHLEIFRSVAWARTVADAKATENQLDLLSRFMGELRGICTQEGRRRGRPFTVAIRVPDSFEYCRAIGIDLERWLREKSVDVVIIGGYFQLNPWQETVSRIHALGAKALVSLDESRVGMNKSAYPFGYLPGRAGGDLMPFYAARMANAAAQGADGVCFFNCHGSFMERIGAVDPSATEGIDKRYFAVERGQGGYEERHALMNGDTGYSTMPRLDPWKPMSIVPGGSYAFEMSIGDDFATAKAKGLTAKVIAKALLDTPPSRRVKGLGLRVNGLELGEAEYASLGAESGTYTFEVPCEVLKRGQNRIELLLPSSAIAPGCHFVDFVIEVAYPDSAGN